MTHRLIPWRDKTYRAIEITIFPGTDEEEFATVSTEELEEVLLPEIENGNKQAIALDEEIIYYVTPDEINLPEEQIREIVQNAISE
jgi:hypothetical protein